MHKHFVQILYTALGRLYVKPFLASGKYAVFGGKWAGLVGAVDSKRLTVWEVFLTMYK